MPSAAQELLFAMQSDVWKFYRMICLSSSQYDGYMLVEKYHEFPILQYVEPSAFIEKLLQMKFEDQRNAFWALTERYQFDNINEKLLEELEWLKSVRDLLLEQANCKKGRLSGFRLESLNKHYLSEIIEKLEAKRRRSQSHQ